MASPVDIRPDHLRIVRNVLREYLPPNVNAWVFGSRANWTATDSSDLDLALKGDSRLGRKTMGALEDAFEDSSLPYTVDVIDLNRISDSFRRIVEAQRVPFPVAQDSGEARISRRRVHTSDVATATIEQKPSRNGASSRKTSAPSEWQVVNLGVYVVINDRSYSTKEAWPFINYLDTGNISENHIAEIQKIDVNKHKIPSRARRKVQPGDIVYSMVRPNQKHFGLLKKIPENFLVSTGFAVLRGKDNLADTDFLYWFLAQDHIVEYLHSIAENSTSTYPAIRPSDLERISLSLPPLPEQRAIAHVLGTLNDKIELNRQMNKTFEEMARALFKSWFVDFDPVRAKMDGRWRPGKSLPGLPANLYDFFPNCLVSSEMGEIPEGWKVKALGELIQLAYGKALKADDRREGIIPVYGSNGQIGWHAERLVTGPGIIVGRKGNPGVVTWVQSNFFPIDTTFYVVPTGTSINLAFLLYALIDQDLSSIAADSAVPGLNRNLAYMSRQIVPDKRVVDEFGNCINTIFKRRYHIEEESRSLAVQRDVLLPKLISGELHTSQLVYEKSTPK